MQSVSFFFFWETNAFTVALPEGEHNAHSCFVWFSFVKSSLPLQAEWVALNYVPFAERSLEVVVDLYHKTACHKAVINEKVLQNIIKVFIPGWCTRCW